MCVRRGAPRSSPRHRVLSAPSAEIRNTGIDSLSGKDRSGTTVPDRDNQEPAADRADTSPRARAGPLPLSLESARSTLIAGELFASAEPDGRFISTSSRYGRWAAAGSVGGIGSSPANSTASGTRCRSSTDRRREPRYAIGLTDFPCRTNRGRESPCAAESYCERSVDRIRRWRLVSRLARSCCRTAGSRHQDRRPVLAGRQGVLRARLMEPGAGTPGYRRTHRSAFRPAFTE